MTDLNYIGSVRGRHEKERQVVFSGKLEVLKRQKEMEKERKRERKKDRERVIISKSVSQSLTLRVTL